MAARDDGDDDGFYYVSTSSSRFQMVFLSRLWIQLTAQLPSIMKDVRDVCGSARKKIEKFRLLLLGVFSGLTNFDEVKLVTLLTCSLSALLQC